MIPANILYLHPSNELYGADRSLLRLVRGLDRSKYIPYVVVASDLRYEGLLTNELLVANIPFTTSNMSVLRRRYLNASGLMQFACRFLISSFHIAAYARQNSIDLIHSNSLAVPVGALVSRLIRKPHIWHVREIITQPVQLNSLLSNLLLHFSDQIIAVSESVRQHLIVENPLLSDKIAVIYNGIDTTLYDQVIPAMRNRLRTTWQANPDTVVIGMVGRISAWKGQELLIKSIAKLLRQAHNVKVVLVGSSVPGEEDQLDDLNRLIAHLNIQDKVHLEEFRSDIPDVLSAFDIFVLPSIRPDPFPTVVLEAMASRLPVIATAHGGPLEQVVRNETGFLVSPTDPNELAAAMYLLVQHPQLRKKFGVEGRKRLEENFTVQRYLEKVASIYDLYL